MSLAPELLEVLACPKCHAPVEVAEGGLLCSACELLYPVEDDVPVMIAEEAVKSDETTDEEVVTMGSSQTVIFHVVEGKNKGVSLKLPKAACRAIGRSLDDLESTRVFEVGSVIGLDDSTKKLVLNYITQHFQGGRSASAPVAVSSEAGISEENIGSFKRLPDLALSDGAVSRLHAMIFHDRNGVGILDLVSKNGTFVNGTEVESKFLKDGDLVTIGGTKLRIEYPKS